MTLADHVAALKEHDGGFTLRIEFLGADGAALDRGNEVVVADALVRGGAFAYVHAGGGRPHGGLIERVLWEGDDEDDVVIIPTHRQHRMTFGIVWTEEHRRVLDQWQATKHEWVEPLLREYLDDLERAPPFPDRASVPPQEFTASWRARLGDDGILHTVGALLLGGHGELKYASARPEPHASKIEAAFGRGPAAEVFEYLVRSGNGITNDWSVPFVVSAPNIEFAAARLMTRLRLAGNPAGHLRELWLSAWPDTAQYVAEEAEVVAKQAGLPSGAERYLALVRATLCRADLDRR